MRGKCTSPAWFTLIYKITIPYDAFSEWTPHISFQTILAIKIFACKYISEKYWLCQNIGNTILISRLFGNISDFDSKHLSQLTCLAICWQQNTGTAC